MVGSGQRIFSQMPIIHYFCEIQPPPPSTALSRTCSPVKTPPRVMPSGYNLCALKSIGRYAATSEFESNIQRGFEFYRKNFFREDGAPKYFHDHTYPIDIHSVAQSIITLTAFKNLDKTGLNLAQAVFQWAMDNMWDEQGYFFYQVLPLIKVRIPYMRWSQAWVLLALSTLLEHCGQAESGKLS